jgi:hypothetical protein
MEPWELQDGFTNAQHSPPPPQKPPKQQKQNKTK